MVSVFRIHAAEFQFNPRSSGFHFGGPFSARCGPSSRLPTGSGLGTPACRRTTPEPDSLDIAHSHHLVTFKN